MSLPNELARRLAEAGLDPVAILALVSAAIDEDLGGGGDVTTEAVVPFDQKATADFVVRQSGVIAGLPIVAALLSVVTGGVVDIDEKVLDGARVDAGTVLLSATATTRALLTGERTALNLLCHLSGIATLTRVWVDAANAASAPDGRVARIRDTRKTTPGLRALEKYAVRCGGGLNHRMSLSDAALVKDNHVLAAGGVREAFEAVRRTFPGVPVEVECDNLDQVREAISAGADLVLLDNMTPALISEAVELVRVGGFRCRLEASGGLTLASVAEVAATGVDYLSIGALTHSAPVLDIGLDLRPLGSPPR